MCVVDRASLEAQFPHFLQLLSRVHVELFVRYVGRAPFAHQIADPDEHARRPNVPGVECGKPGGRKSAVRSAAEPNTITVHEVAIDEVLDAIGDVIEFLARRVAQR